MAFDEAIHNRTAPQAGLLRLWETEVSSPKLFVGLFNEMKRAGQVRM
jgi:hypothetical protein